jgi:homoisocitrate dehydrogenase
MQILLIPGDGIGPEVMAAAAAVLRTAAPDVELREAQAGWGAFEATGSALPAETLELARAADAILFGAVASPSHAVPGYRSPIVQLRRELDLYANIRPVHFSSPSDSSPSDSSSGSPGHRVTGSPSALVVVRENTEGLYAGRERLEDDGATAIAERVITRRASERIARTAFDLARTRRRTKDEGRKTQGAGWSVTDDVDRPSSLVDGRSSDRRLVTIVHKANVLRVSDGLFRSTALAVAAEFPDVTAEEMLVDVAAMRLAQTPERFDVIVTTNMFGDILSDVACIHGGGLGMAASANLGAGRALFEPVHGAAPDIAGRGIANPLAAIECVAMLLEWRERREAAAAVRAACAATTRAGIVTPDLGGTATTRAVTDSVCTYLVSGSIS